LFRFGAGSSLGPIGIAGVNPGEVIGGIGCDSESGEIVAGGVTVLGVSNGAGGVRPGVLNGAGGVKPGALGAGVAGNAGAGSKGEPA